MTKGRFRRKQKPVYDDSFALGLLQLEFSRQYPFSRKFHSELASVGTLVRANSRDELTFLDEEGTFFLLMIRGVCSTVVEHDDNVYVMDLGLTGDTLEVYDVDGRRPHNPRILFFHDSLFLKVRLSDFLDRMDDPSWRRFYQMIRSNQAERKIVHQMLLMRNDLKQRYVDLLSRRPALIDQVPSKYIASYLGVTPETLSRAKKLIYEVLSRRIKH